MDQANKYFTGSFINRVPLKHFGLVCSYHEDGYYTNVPWRVKHHAPDGFSWGYMGSGPADLALNILDYALHEMEGELLEKFDHKLDHTAVDLYMGKCSLEAYTLHQKFKEEVLALLLADGGFVTWNDIYLFIMIQLGLKIPYEREPVREIIFCVPQSLLEEIYGRYSDGYVDKKTSTANFFSAMSASIATCHGGPVRLSIKCSAYKAGDLDKILIADSMYKSDGVAHVIQRELTKLVIQPLLFIQDQKHNSDGIRYKAVIKETS